VIWLELVRANHEAAALACLFGGAALAVIVGGVRLSGAIAVLATAASAAIATDAAWRGLFATAPPGPTADGVSVFAAPLIGTGAFCAALAGSVLARAECGARAAPFAFVLLLCMAGGWLGALFADDLVTLVAAAEAGWLSMVGLAGLAAHQARGALNGALRMLVLGGLGAVLLLLGVGLLARGAGAWDVAALASADGAGQGAVAAGMAFVVVALATKAGVAPLHDWTGPVYGRGGSFAVLCISVVGSIGALALLARLAVHVTSIPAIANGVAAGIIGLGVVSIVTGSVQAISARNLGRLAGYAGAAQAGCFLVGVGLASRVGYEAAMLQLLAQQAAMLGLLCGMAAAGPGAALTQLDGLYRRAPLASAAMAAGALCLMGAPLTTGFLARWRLMEAGAGGGWWIAAAAAIGASIAGVYYGGRLMERIYFRRASVTLERAGRLRALALAPAMIAAIIVVGAGFNPTWLMQAANAAAELAMSAAP
jgi:formate hydrogenlyase subunit 3/multisubunit Na+/H+ antiporter MnhD subunit